MSGRKELPPGHGHKRPMGEQSVPEWGLEPWIAIVGDEADLTLREVIENEEAHVSELAVPDPVEGYRYFTGYDDARDGQIVQIVDRAEMHVLMADDAGPCFVIEFPDGTRGIAMHNELHPWFEL